MVIYEVIIEVKPEILLDYRKWLKTHVNEILQIDGFISAKIYENTEDKLENEITVHYKVENMEKMQFYFEHLASIKRAEAVSLFKDQFRARRRVMRELIL